ncbi:hypothetical protein PUR29_34530 [Methylobacterium ajmalii]|uniref:Uncharacterized protein n=1 Tax=Methylobacterium ajmalii TaxID=2738439 RepID=A0ABV0A427_9HYPH
MNRAVWGSFWTAWGAIAVAFFTYVVACGLDTGPNIQNLDRQIKNPFVRAATELEVTFDFEMIQVCAAWRYGAITDSRGKRHEFPVVDRGVLSELGHHHYTLGFPVPADAEPGLAKLQLRWSLECSFKIGPILIPNFFQQMTPKSLNFPDLEFTILKRGRKFA